MRITYVLPRPELSGGNKVVCQHARLLGRLGHRVTVVGEGPRPDWFDFQPAGPAGAAGSGVEYRNVLAPFPPLPEQDLVVATFWTTLATASRWAPGPLAHFCQGYEGGLVHLRPALAEIEAAYARALPTLVVSPHLGELLRERFGRESRLVTPPLDPLFHPALRWRPRRAPWVAIPGIFEAEVKGIPRALAAVQLLRHLGYPCRVLRFSILPLTEEERRILEPDLYLCGMPPREIARALRRCDLTLFPSRAEEGFGLPLLEAMASGVPAVAFSIPATEHVAGGALPLVAADDVAAMAEAARALLADPAAWRRARRQAAKRAQRFRPEVVGPELVGALDWAVDRAGGRTAAQAGGRALAEGAA
jgi:glycosyltransferase involved in cell wall biosynthesis